MARLLISTRAQKDIATTLRWTRERFGVIAFERYRRLISSALLDLSVDPKRIGSTIRPEFGEQVRSYHLRHSKKGSDVGRPRHVIVYMLGGDDTVEIGRVLHDAMELERHVRFEPG